MVTMQEAHRIDATKEARARVTYILKRLVTILNPDFQFDSDVSAFRVFIHRGSRPPSTPSGWSRNAVQSPSDSKPKCY